MFTARYGLSPYIKQMFFIFKWLKLNFPNLDHMRQAVHSLPSNSFPCTINLFIYIKTNFNIILLSETVFSHISINILFVSFLYPVAYGLPKYYIYYIQLRSRIIP